MPAAARTTTDAARRAVAFDTAFFERGGGVPPEDFPPVAVLDEALALGRVTADDEALAAELRSRGWSDHPILLLGRSGTLEPPEAVALAEEVPYGAVRGLRDEWVLSEGLPFDEVRASDARLFGATPTRAFAVFEQGRPVAYALLVDGGRDGMLEDVYTTPSHRGRGLAVSAIAAVLHASRAARHELVFVPTDAEDGARGLYERLGFEPLAVRHRMAKPS